MPPTLTQDFLNACFAVLLAPAGTPRPHTQPPPSKTRSPLLHLATPAGSLTCQLPIRIAVIALQINDLDGTLVRQAGPVHGAITPFLPLKIMHGCIRARVMFVWAASSVAMLKEARLLWSALPAILLLNLMFYLIVVTRQDKEPIIALLLDQRQ